MDIIKNPFWVLDATTRDNKRRIMELTEEKSLLSDEEDISSASSILTNPRKRLTAEMAWLPGLGPSRVSEVVTQVQNKPYDILQLDNINLLAKANLLSAGLSRVADRADGDDVLLWIIELAKVFDNIDLETVVTLINEEREVSGFPSITDHHALETEIDSRRQFYKSVIRDALNELSPDRLVEVITEAVETTTSMGDKPAPLLIDDLVDTYEVDAQDFLDKEEENIDAILKKIHSIARDEGPESVLKQAVEELISVVENWDKVAQPIQVSTKSRGLGHEASVRVAGKVRDVGIDLFNEHGKLELSREISVMLQKVFAEVVDVADQTGEDIVKLDELAEQLVHAEERSAQEEAEWARDIALEIEIGAVFKETFKISTSGIQWKGKTIPIEEITRVRWGGTSHSVNGIPTGTNYIVAYGNNTFLTTVHIRKGKTYEAILSRFWKAVCVKILIKTIERLKNGDSIQIRNISVTDFGVNIPRKKFIGSGEPEFCKWSELKCFVAEGCFHIGKKDDKKLFASLSYQDDDNIHIIETAIRHKLKTPGNSISESFG
jgi:hypothetical protein